MGCRSEGGVGHTRVKLLLDMNIPKMYAELLAKKGIETLRWSDVGAPDAPDTEIMAYARDNDYIVLTYDLDFGTILSVTHQLKPSVAQIRASIKNAERAVELVTAALLKNEFEMENGAILSVDFIKARVRLLPV